MGTKFQRKKKRRITVYSTPKEGLCSRTEEKYLALTTKISMGVSLNNRAAVFLPNYTIQDLLKMAELAEDLGFGSVWVGDSLIDSPRYESMAVLGAVAARTSKVKLGGAIIQPHFRNPVMLALTWATLDCLSSGRMILTLGTGGGTPAGVAKEAELVGIDPKKRGGAIEENVDILRKLWSGAEIEKAGKLYDLRGAKIGYYPLQKPPPIWIAAGIWIPKSRGDRVVSATPGYTKKKGESEFTRNFDRAARLGDGWFAIMATPEEYGEASRKVSELARRYGRSPEKITRAMEIWINVNADRDLARRQVTDVMEGYFGSAVDPQTVERWSIYGTREECLKKIEAYEEGGLQVTKLNMGSRDQLGMLREVGKSILSSF